MKNKKTDPEDPLLTGESPSGTPSARASSKTNRRSFLARAGVGATLLAVAGQAYAFLRSLVPNVLYESPRRFKVGLPDQFGEGA